MLILGTQGEVGSIYKQGIHNCFLICFQNSSVFSLIATVGAGTGTRKGKTNGSTEPHPSRVPHVRFPGVESEGVLKYSPNPETILG